MIRSVCLLSIFSIFAISVSVNAQERQPNSGGQNHGARRRAVVLDISTRVLEEEQVVVWNENLRRVGIPGSPVGMRLEGENLIVAVQFTPIIRRNGHVLVVQGQIWIDDPEKGICYYTSIQTIPMEFGEPIYFFPLGSEQLDAAIEIIITVNPYNEAGAAEEASAAADNDR